MAGIIDRVTEYLTAKNEVRDLTLSRSRSLIRFCANSIRAAHRHEYDEARALLAEAQEAARTVQADASAYPDIYHAGYLQDALKELAEASIVLAIVTGQPIPDPDELGIEYAAYLNGLAEAMGEMRRYALDSMRRDDIAAAEALLEVMDDVYSHLVTIDFPDALTGGLRRTTDMVRGVTERTRGDLTTAYREERLQEALQALEAKLDCQTDST
ncbi:MAG: haloacid dehalogenase [Chloroflexi bacterium]|nr:haloacid dehalogenase [Chloroflexota bacterium]